MPDNTKSIEQARISIDACIKNGIDDYLVTSWGDAGSEASLFVILPALYSIAKIARGEEIDENEFERIVGVKYEDFLLLDKVNNPGNSEHALRQITTMLLYNDVFQNVADGLVYDGLNQFYRECAEELAAVQGGEFQYIFDSVRALCEVLSVKSELGKKLRQSYSVNNKDELSKIVQDIQSVIDKIGIYEKVYRKQWYRDNKSFGYHYVSLKIGAVKERLQYCAECVQDYLANELCCIEELEETVIYAYNDINHDAVGFFRLLGHGYN